MSTTLEFSKITTQERNTVGVKALSDRPNKPSQYGVGGLTAQELKEWFDKFANLLANKFNDLCDIFKGDGGADVAQYIKLSFGSYETMRDVLNGIDDGSFADTMMAYASASAQSAQELSSLQSIINSMAESISNSITTENLTDHIVDNLTSDDATKALSAKQGKALKAIADLKIAISSIADNLTTDDATKVLSAKQGKKLNDEKIDKTSIADNLTTNDATKVLSAKQGKTLDEKKVEKYTTADSKKYAYTVENGAQGKTEITETPTAGKLPVYGTNGILKTGDPANDNNSSQEVVNVKFLRGKIGNLNVALSMDSSTYKIKAILKEGNNLIDESDEIDLPLETMVINLTYSNGNIIATLKNGNTMVIPITDVIEDSDFYYLLVAKDVLVSYSRPSANEEMYIYLNSFSRTPVVGEHFVVFFAQKYVNPTTQQETLVDTFIAQCKITEIDLHNNDPESAFSRAKVVIKSVYSTKGATGAKLLSQQFTGYDATGNAVYVQTFDDGTTATFISPKGDAGRLLTANIVINAEPSATVSAPLSIATYFPSIANSYPLMVNEEFYAMFSNNGTSYLALCKVYSINAEQATFTYTVADILNTTGATGAKGDTGLTYINTTQGIDVVPQVGDVYVFGVDISAGDQVSYFNRTPVVGEVYTKYYNYSGQNGIVTYMVTQVITAINSTTGGITAQVQDVHVVTGAVPVSTTFVGTDANGGNVYSILFSNGTTATITAPKGEGSSIGLFNGKAIDRYIFNHRISVEQMEAYLSTLTYENGVSLLVDTTDGIGVYAIRLSDMDASGSGYAVAVVTVDPNEGMTINEIVFVSQFSYANVGIAQYALDDENFTFSAAGWLGNGSYVFQSETQVDGDVETEVNAFVSSDNSFWNMVYNLVDEDITNAKSGVTALHTEIDSLVAANNLVGTAGLTYTYDDTNGTAVCTGGSVSGDIVIPAYVKNNGKLYKVTKIEDDAFKDNTNITSITLSSQLTSIGDNAFRNCTSLDHIDLKLFSTTKTFNLNHIGSHAFDGCSSLGLFDNVSFNNRRPFTLLLDHEIEIGGYAFKGTNFTEVEIKSPRISIYQNAFQNCTSLTTVELDYLYYRGNNVFDGCTSLTTVNVTNDRTITMTVPSGVTVNYYRRTKNPVRKYLHSFKVHSSLAPSSSEPYKMEGEIVIVSERDTAYTTVAQILADTTKMYISANGYGFSYDTSTTRVYVCPISKIDDTSSAIGITIFTGDTQASVLNINLNDNSTGYTFTDTVMSLE